MRDHSTLDQVADESMAHSGRKANNGLPASKGDSRWRHHMLVIGTFFLLIWGLQQMLWDNEWMNGESRYPAVCSLLITSFPHSPRFLARLIDSNFSRYHIPRKEALDPGTRFPGRRQKGARDKRDGTGLHVVRAW